MFCREARLNGEAYLAGALGFRGLDGLVDFNVTQIKQRLGEEWFKSSHD